MKNKYTVDYFIKKFSAIPRSKWTTGFYTNGNGQYCALGHCGRNPETKVYDTPEAIALTDLFISKFEMGPISVNDGNAISPFKQRTPKGRILAALKQLKRNTLGKKAGRK